MAIVFMVVAECGENQESAQRIVSHFMGIRWVLPGEISMRFESDTSSIWRRGNVVWCAVHPEGVSLDGTTQRIKTDEVRAEIAKRCYAELRILDCFRFALVGWEVADDNWEDILKTKGSPDLLPLGLVVNDDLWTQLGQPPGFERFGSRSRWKPLSEEDYLRLVESW